MELVEHIGIGLTSALTFQNLLYCFIGVVLGTMVGILPGLGPVATIAMLLPATFALPPVAALIMLAGIYYGAQYGGSTTAILINLPGESSSVVTALDGYQMARQGRAGVALATSAIGSFFAGTVATLLVMMFAPPLAELALKFGPAEYFSLMVLGLIASVVLAHGSLLKAIAIIVLGLLIGLIGTDVTSGQQRFTFGVPDLSDGLGFVTVAMGMFGIGEILANLEHEQTRTAVVAKITKLLPSKEDWKRIIGPILRGTTFGSILGILPGGGALLSSFASYAIEKKISKNSSEFGKGAIEGVAAPEAANNAGAQTSFIPMLTLGIPSNPVMALMVGAMIIQGIQPGPQVMSEQPALFCGDTLFNAGAGNCHHGGHPAELYQTFVDQLARLDERTLVYPGHDYIANNLRFTLDREPDNAAARELFSRTEHQDPAHAMVSTLALEKEINTFFRLRSPTVIARLREAFPELDESPDPKTVFLKLRELRNSW